MKTLTKVKLINWHTFSNTEFEIYKNALITGENGTGKSTILDAIQYVLTVGKCKFNKAASDIGNRTLESYIRCKTGIEGHEYVRNGDVTTYIVLEFFDEKTKDFILYVIDNYGKLYAGKQQMSPIKTDLPDDVEYSDLYLKIQEDMQSTGENFLKPWDTYLDSNTNTVMQDNLLLLASGDLSVDDFCKLVDDSIAEYTK